MWTGKRRPVCDARHIQILSSVINEAQRTATGQAICSLANDTGTLDLVHLFMHQQNDGFYVILRFLVQLSDSGALYGDSGLHPTTNNTIATPLVTRV